MRRDPPPPPGRAGTRHSPHAPVPSVDRPIVQLVAAGLTYAQAGKPFDMSESEVKDVMRRLRAWYRARNNVHLIWILKHNNLIY